MKKERKEKKSHKGYPPNITQNCPSPPRVLVLFGVIGLNGVNGGANMWFSLERQDSQFLAVSSEFVMKCVDRFKNTKVQAGKGTVPAIFHP